MRTVPLNAPIRQLREESALLHAALDEVIESGWLIHGPQHAAFEGELADFVGVPHCVGVGNGTDALALSLRAALDVSPGRVLTVANAGGFTSVAARMVGAAVGFVDVDPVTHLMTPESLSEVIDHDTGVVVVTHLYGAIADAPALRAMCEEFGAVLIEDCAQALGGARDGVQAGTTGTLATTSFYPIKNLGALGDGGAILCRDTVLADRLRALRQYGWSGKAHVEHPHGVNSRLDELQAAFLRRRLPNLHTWNERRREILQRYDAACPPGLRIVGANQDGAHVGHLAVLECPDADLLRAHLGAHGITTDVHYPVPDHHQPPWRDGSVLPVTESFVGRILSLPCFPQLTDEDVTTVCDALTAFRPTELTDVMPSSGD